MAPLILAAPAVVLWLFLARTHLLRWIVAAVLVGWAVTAAVLFARFPRAMVEINLAAFLGPVLIVAGTCTVVAVIRRDEVGWRVAPLTLLFVWGAGMGCLSAAILADTSPDQPSTDEVLPMPAGLHATVQPQDVGSCGSHSCTTYIDVTGGPGQSTHDVYLAVMRHLAERGWTSECRRQGWLIDLGTECVDVSQESDHVEIRLSGDDGPTA